MQGITAQISWAAIYPPAVHNRNHSNAQNALRRVFPILDVPHYFAKSERDPYLGCGLMIISLHFTNTVKADETKDVLRS
jgi:hypothetical protein